MSRFASLISSPSRSARPDSISHACFANFFASSAYGFANSGSLLCLLVHGGAAGGGCSALTATNARARVESGGAVFQNWTAVIAVRIVTMITAAGFAAARVGMPFSTAFCTTLSTAGRFSGVAAFSWARRATRARLDAAWHIAPSLGRRTHFAALRTFGTSDQIEPGQYTLLETDL